MKIVIAAVLFAFSTATLATAQTAAAVKPAAPHMPLRVSPIGPAPTAPHRVWPEDPIVPVAHRYPYGVVQAVGLPAQETGTSTTAVTGKAALVGLPTPMATKRVVSGTTGPALPPQKKSAAQ